MSKLSFARYNKPLQSLDELIFKKIEGKVKVETENVEKLNFNTKRSINELLCEDSPEVISLSSFLAESLITDLGIDKKLLLVIDSLKTSILALSCYLRNHDIGQMILLDTEDKSGRCYSESDNGNIFNNFIINKLQNTGAVCMVLLNDAPKIKKIEEFEHAPFIVVLNTPTEGSADCTSFCCSWAIFRQPETLSLILLDRDALMEGNKVLAAGYAVISLRTTMVLSLANRKEVMEFFYEENTGDFMSPGPIKYTEKSKDLIYSETHFKYFDRDLRNWIKNKKLDYYEKMKQDYHPIYSGNLILDVHSVILHGGVFLAPRDSDRKDGRLRLLFDCVPLSFIATKMGFIATNEECCILSKKPQCLSEKTAFLIGTPDCIKEILGINNTKNYTFNRITV